MFKINKTFYNKEEKIFKILLWFLIIIIWIFVYFKINIYLIQNNIEEQKINLNQEEEKLAEYEKVVDYKKFMLTKNLEEKSTNMPWFEHIPKIMAIFEDLKNVDASSTDTITLSDFKVSLSEISLKWSVSSLKALYYSSPNGKFKSLLDKFQELDFIKDMEIKNYEKVWDRYFEFVLNAKLTNDDTK